MQKQVPKVSCRLSSMVSTNIEAVNAIVKAAIAAMKAAKQQMLNNKTPSSASRRASTDSSSTRNDSLMDGMSWGSSSGRLPARTSDGTESEGWVIEPMKSMVKKAKNTGKSTQSSWPFTAIGPVGVVISIRA